MCMGWTGEAKCIFVGGKVVPQSTDAANRPWGFHSALLPMVFAKLKMKMSNEET